MRSSSALRREITAAGVPAGAKTPNHERAVKPGRVSAMVGRSGSAGALWAPLVAIARAILASPQILILDEATSNLDTESEQLIQASMATLLAGRTTFVIAHRLSTVRRADLILLMEDGRVIERGTHDELMRTRGTYYDMVLRQMASHGEEVPAIQEPISRGRIWAPDGQSLTVPPYGPCVLSTRHVGLCLNLFAHDRRSQAEQLKCIENSPSVRQPRWVRNDEIRMTKLEGMIK